MGPQRLRVHTARGEEPCVGTIRCLITTCNSSFRGSVQGILDSVGTCTHVVHRNFYRHRNIHQWTIKCFKKENKKTIFSLFLSANGSWI